MVTKKPSRYVLYTFLRCIFNALQTLVWYGNRCCALVNHRWSNVGHRMGQLGISVSVCLQWTSRRNWVSSHFTLENSRTMDTHGDYAKETQSTIEPVEQRKVSRGGWRLQSSQAWSSVTTVLLHIKSVFLHHFRFYHLVRNLLWSISTGAWWWCRRSSGVSIDDTRPPLSSSGRTNILCIVLVFFDLSILRPLPCASPLALCQLTPSSCNGSRFLNVPSSASMASSAPPMYLTLLAKLCILGKDERSLGSYIVATYPLDKRFLCLSAWCLDLQMSW